MLQQLFCTMLCKSGQVQAWETPPKAQAVFENLGKQALDPFVRFPGEQVAKREFFLKNWSDPDVANVQGHVFEVIVASHSIHHGTCFLCKRPNTLHWNGGAEGAWADMECAAHDSVPVRSRPQMKNSQRLLRIIP